MDVLQHGHFLETVGVVLDLEVNFSFCARVFSMSIINFICHEKSVFNDLKILVIAVSKLSQSMD